MTRDNLESIGPASHLISSHLIFIAKKLDRPTTYGSHGLRPSFQLS